MVVLVTGGAGYIGSHTAVELVNAGYDIVVLDNLSNSSCKALDRLEEITGKPITFKEGDIRDPLVLDEIFLEHDITSVIHFAGLKSVGESTSQPLRYYDNNVTGTIMLCEAMNRHGVKNLVFSSSATVYGEPEMLPLRETARTGATNPYGQSKLIVENVLSDLYKSDPSWNIVCLRYFNPVGAHESGLIGESPNGTPNNLMPFVTQVASRIREKVLVFGADYNTPDGTGVRDYIHVVDLARAHICSLRKILSKPGYVTYNIGTGKGYSVLDVISAVGKASGVTIPYDIAPRREGDVASCFADPSLAKKELNWSSEFDLLDMAESSVRWQVENPLGFQQ